MDYVKASLNFQQELITQIHQLNNKLASVEAELEALKATADCQWCGDRPTRAVLDGDRLCQSCCDKWVRGQREV